MRLVGPDCFRRGRAGIGLDATFAASRLRPGVAGLMSQSGGVGVALTGQLSRLGVGDLLVRLGGQQARRVRQRHADVVGTRRRDQLAVLYLESFGNPRKFARTARRVGAKMPVLTVRSWSFRRRPGAFEQAGVIATAPSAS
jgi:acyl-CoA synthetase (NDP forming)